jgi:hypothetical protein
MPCPFFSRPNKKQLHACRVLRNKVAVVKGICLRAAEIENVTFEQRENVKFYQKLGKSANKTFQMIKQAYGEEDLAVVLCLSGTNVLHKGDEHTGRPRTVRTELEIQEVATLVRNNCFRMVDEITAAAGISHGTYHKILFDDLNMSHVTQHSVPRVLTQDQRDNCMRICGDLIDSAIPTLADLHSGQRRLF